MKATLKVVEKKNINSPDERRDFPKGKIELLTVGGTTLGRATLEPGWKWSESVKPLVKTESCEAEHIQYFISGRMKVRMNDGSEYEFGPGDVAYFPPGHEAWVVGNEPVQVIDITGLAEIVEHLKG